MRTLFTLLSFILSASLLYSEQEKYTLSICAIFKNETKYLQEWIEYHRLIGVDHFYLYDDSSRDHANHKLHEYIQKGIVTLNSWPQENSDKEEEPITWVLVFQTPAYEHAIKKYQNETKWLVFLDVNEFLVPDKEDHIGKILDQYNGYSGLKIQIHYFDASQKEICSDLVLESSIKTASPPPNLKDVEKQIVRPKECKMFTWPPYRCELKNQSELHLVKESDLCVNHYINRKRNCLYSNQRRIHLNNSTLSKAEEEEILENNYEFEDQKKKVFHFLPKLKEKLGEQK